MRLVQLSDHVWVRPELVLGVRLAQKASLEYSTPETTAVIMPEREIYLLQPLADVLEILRAAEVDV